MVTTRSQARKSATTRLEDHLMKSNVIAPRRSPRKRATSAVTPKAKAQALSKTKSPATASAKAKVKKGKAKSKKQPGPQPSPVVSTPARRRRRSDRPVTPPRAPRKSDATATAATQAPEPESSFPRHLTFLPPFTDDPAAATPSSVGSTDVDTMDHNGRFVTPTPTNGGPRVRFDPVEHCMLIPPRQEDSNTQVASSSSSSAYGGGEIAGPSTTSAPRFWSTQELTTMISGDWIPSPGQTTRRLILVPEDTSSEAAFRRELDRQSRCDEIFREQYEILLRNGEGSHQLFAELLGGRGGDVMDI